jgi:hypothetical protein
LQGFLQIVHAHRPSDSMWPKLHTCWVKGVKNV